MLCPRIARMLETQPRTGKTSMRRRTSFLLKAKEDRCLTRATEVGSWCSGEAAELQQQGSRSLLGSSHESCLREQLEDQLLPKPCFSCTCQDKRRKASSSKERLNKTASFQRKSKSSNSSSRSACAGSANCS